ncbi:Translocase of chloroplast 159, chloroplastic, partial [Cucurbita argyrosperma subsp. sororia]
MESKDLSQQPSLQNSAFSGSSSTYSSSFSSSSVDSNVDMPSREMEVSEIKTGVGGDGDGSDGGGSETEGFLSGEEEFESAFDRPIVEYPEEESFENSIKGGDSGSSFVSCSEFSAPEGVRPIAKISVDSDVEEEDDGLQVDESLGRNEEIDDKVDGEDFVDSKGNEIDIPVEKEETLVSGGNADVSDVVNEGDASQVYERTFELSGNTKESDVPESSIAEDVGSVFEETANGGKQVSEEDELNDVTVEQRPNEASKGGKEAELNKESPMTEKQADEGIGLNEKVVAEVVEQLKEQESPGSSSDDKADLGDQASSKLSKLADGEQEAGTEKGSLMAENQADGEVELNDKVAAEDGEHLKNLETGSPVDDKAVLGDDEISKFIKLADGGQEVEIDKGSPAAEMQADGKIILNDMEDAEDGEQLPKLESGSSVGSKDDQDDQANSKVTELENSEFLELADGGEEAEMDKGSSVAEMQADRKIILNEMEAAEDGERLPKLESGSSVDSKADQDDQANSKVAELENSKFLEYCSLPAACGKKAVELPKLDNGFDNVGHETDDSVDQRKLLEAASVIWRQRKIAKNENLAAMDVEDQQPDEKDSKYDSKIREDLPGEVEPKPSQEARSLVKESIPDNASVIDSGISDAPKALKPVLNEVDGEKHPLDEEGDIEGSVTDGETEGEIFSSSEAAREFMEELERASGAGFHSGAESSIDQSQKIDGGRKKFGFPPWEIGPGRVNYREDKTPINAFGPGTTSVKEIIGTVEGVKIRIFDSPGLRSSSSERRINHRILSSIKNVMKKFPPDIVLYVDRLDNQTRDLNDLLLLRSVSSYLGSSVWKNAIITLTHAASAPPDGPSGSPLGYEVFVAQRSHVLQQTVAQAVGDLRILNPTLMNPVSLVENHPSCRKNRDGQKVLPNGQSWRPQLLLLCFSIKILAEVGNLSKAPETFDHRKLFGLRSRSPPLPYLLSGLLQSRTHPKLPSDQNGDNGDSDIDLADLSDSDQEEEEDEYDQLPPFKPLRKSQVSKLSKEQRKAYFEEYDYRVKLLQKKQWKEELKRMRDMKKGQQPTVDDYGYMGEDDQENGGPAAVQVPLPDMALPPSFDGDNPAYRFRFLEPTSQFLARPVLDTHGWDHDCGYDGVNLEHSMAIVSRFPAAVAVQITKDKKEFNIHLDSSVSAKHGENGSTMAGFDIQNIGRQLAYILRGETKFKSFRKNKTAAGVSVTFLGENVCPGFKVEDQITLGKRVVLVGSTGTVRSQGDSAFGANLEMRLREADFPIGQDQSSLGLSLVKWRGDTALGANFQSQFSVGRSYKMAVRAGINNKLSGQISVKTSSSDQLQIALLALLPVARAIYNSLRPGVAEHYSAY